jgi:hypothetical protein
MAKKPKDSAPQKPAPAGAASRAEGPSPTAGTGAPQAPVTDPTAGDVPAAIDSSAGATPPAADHTRERKTEAEGAADSAAAPEAADAGTRFIILSPPVPADVPPALLEGAVYIVKAKPERGLRRAGRAFTREETQIPYADLSDDQRTAIENESDLVVTIRLTRS